MPSHRNIIGEAIEFTPGQSEDGPKKLLKQVEVEGAPG